jgi:hypothetical protein
MQFADNAISKLNIAVYPKKYCAMWKVGYLIILQKNRDFLRSIGKGSTSVDKGPRCIGGYVSVIREISEFV